MLPRINRLRLTTEFGRIKKEGRLINSPLFGLLVAEPPATSHCLPATRLGFVVSTKIDKRAVVRNRLRRLLSEAVRLNLGKIKPGYEVIFLVKKSSVGKDFAEIKREVEKQLQRNKLWLPTPGVGLGRHLRKLATK